MPRKLRKPIPEPTYTSSKTLERKWEDFLDEETYSKGNVALIREDYWRFGYGMGAKFVLEELKRLIKEYGTKDALKIMQEHVYGDIAWWIEDLDLTLETTGTWYHESPPRMSDTELKVEYLQESI